MARYEVVQKISGCGFPERRVEAQDWAAAREELLFMMEQLGIAEEAERYADAQTAVSQEEHDSIMAEVTVNDLMASMLADTDDPPLIEPESGRWGVTFECYDLSWRNWSIRKL